MHACIHCHSIEQIRDSLVPPASYKAVQGTWLPVYEHDTHTNGSIHTLPPTPWCHPTPSASVSRATRGGSERGTSCHVLLIDCSYERTCLLENSLGSK